MSLCLLCKAIQLDPKNADVCANKGVLEADETKLLALNRAMPAPWRI